MRDDILKNPDSEIVIVTDYKNSYRQDLYSWTSIDVQGFDSKLKQYGYRTQIIPISDVAKSSSPLSNKIVIYTGNEDLNYKSYIGDVLYFLNEDNFLIPPYELFLCHNSKVFQEVMKKRHGITNLRSLCFCALEETMASMDELFFPAVFKLNHGNASQNVHLIHDVSHLQKTIKRLCKRADYHRILAHKILSRRKFKKYLGELDSESLYSRPFVLQEYVPDLTDDWKVIAFYDRLFALNRKTRDNDFRASGSGRYEYAEPPELLLEFASECRKTFDTPFLQMDVGIRDGECYLFEFQVSSFGPYTAKFAPHHFVVGDTPRRVEGTFSLHELFAYSVSAYLKAARNEPVHSP